MSVLTSNNTIPLVAEYTPSLKIRDNANYVVTGAALLGFFVLQYLQARKRKVTVTRRFRLRTDCRLPIDRSTSQRSVLPDGLRRITELSSLFWGRRHYYKRAMRK